MGISTLPIGAVTADPAVDLSAAPWLRRLACVQQVFAEGLRFGPLTVLVGENGSGKSTLVEAIAQAYGLSAEGGSTGARHSTRPTESPLWRALTLQRGAAPSRWGYFLRAETMHGLYTYLEEHPGPRDPRFHEMSHGESFIAMLTSRFTTPGLFVLDEPESALSFTSSLALVQILARIGRSSVSQAIVATHSPLLAATPGAQLLEVNDTGIHERTWEELELVAHWRTFLDDPQTYLRHLEP